MMDKNTCDQLNLLREILSKFQNFGTKVWLLLLSFSFEKGDEILYHQNSLSVIYAVIFLYIFFSA